MTLSRAFKISATEVTQKEFTALLGYNPSSFKADPLRPMMDISWHTAVSYCNALSNTVGLTPCYVDVGLNSHCVDNTSTCPVGERCDPAAKVCRRFVAAKAFEVSKIYDCPGFRLPTEAEWEYAYRADTITAYHSGPSTPGCASCVKGDPKASAIAWYCHNSNKKLQAVKTRAPNAWGLYDMAGNALEWCHDWFLADLGGAPATDPAGATTGIARVVRGGDFEKTAAQIRAAARASYKPTGLVAGFRCVISLTPGPQDAGP